MVIEKRMAVSMRIVYHISTFVGHDDVIGPEGMEKFCEDIGVEPENVS